MKQTINLVWPYGNLYRGFSTRCYTVCSIGLLLLFAASCGQGRGNKTDRNPVLCRVTDVSDIYDGDIDLPIFEHIPADRRRLYSAEDILRIIFKSRKNSQRVCHKVPTIVNKNVVFLVDTSCLEDASDLLSDDMGMWRHNGVDVACLKMKKSEVVRVEKCPTSSTSVYTVRRVYRVHGTNRSLKKLTAYVIGMCTSSMWTGNGFPCLV